MVKWPLAFVQQIYQILRALNTLHSLFHIYIHRLVAITTIFCTTYFLGGVTSHIYTHTDAFWGNAWLSVWLLIR